jgi:hypothetical protein
MKQFHNAPEKRALSVTVLRAVCSPETREEQMFNIVKRRDFMLGRNVPTKEEADKFCRGYGKEYVVVETDCGLSAADRVRGPCDIVDLGCVSG